MSSKRFQSQIVIVSGGADGVGRAAALSFAAEGAAVSVLDINAEKAERTVQDIIVAGGVADFQCVDVSDGLQLRAAIEAVAVKQGRIDVLFNHAGVVVVRPFLQTTVEEWDRLMAINVTSMFHACQAALPHMIAAGGGRIVNTASVSGLSASSLEAAYCVSKGACIQLTRSIAVEFRDQNIRCNAVCPALIRTAHGVREAEQLVALGQSWDEADVARMQGRICEPEEVAAAVLFLASKESSFVNGEMLVIDNAQMATT